MMHADDEVPSHEECDLVVASLVVHHDTDRPVVW